MPAKARKLADILHKTVVTCLIGLTIYGAAHTTIRFYNYFAVVRPELQRQRKLAEEKLLETETSS